MGLPECKLSYLAISEEKRQAAVEWMRTWLPESEHKHFREVILKDPEFWIGYEHLFWGMYVRNQLRLHGFGEDELGIGNLDDCYIEIVEDAVMGDGYVAGN